jgi:hypothetical protein
VFSASVTIAVIANFPNAHRKPWNGARELSQGTAALHGPLRIAHPAANLSASSAAGKIAAATESESFTS